VDGTELGVGAAEATVLDPTALGPGPFGSEAPVAVAAVPPGARTTEPAAVEAPAVASFEVVPGGAAHPIATADARIMAIAWVAPRRRRTFLTAAR
jgi:hypothetical protein